MAGTNGPCRSDHADDLGHDPWYNFNRIASPAWQYGHYNYTSDRTSNNGSPEYGRLSNGIFYDSPSFGGFAFHLSGSFEDSIGPDGGTSNNLGFFLNHDKGPINPSAGDNTNAYGVGLAHSF